MSVPPPAAPISVPPPVAPRPAPVTSAAPPAAVPPTAGAAKPQVALPDDVVNLAKATQAVEGVWGESVLQARAAIEILAKPDASGKVVVPDEAQRSIGRLGFVGQALDFKAPKPPEGGIKLNLPDGATPLDAIKNAEQQFAAAVIGVAQASGKVAAALPADAPAEAAQIVAASRDRLLESATAIKFSFRFIPEPEAKPTTPPTGDAPTAKSAPDTPSTQPSTQPSTLPGTATSPQTQTQTQPNPSAPEPVAAPANPSGIAGTVFGPPASSAVAATDARLAPGSGMTYGTAPGTDPAAKV